jgi:hypothetical protein
VKVERYRCPAEHGVGCPWAAACTPAPEKGRTVSRSAYDGEVEALRERMGGDAAQALYKRRKQTVELVNADGKGHRHLRRFSGRGVTRAECQVGLIMLGHNLLTLRGEESKAKATTAARGPADPDPG